MPRSVSESISNDALDAPSMLLEKVPGGVRCSATFMISRDDNRTHQETIFATLAELQAASVITNGERTAFLATLVKIRDGLRVVAGLVP